MSKEELDNINSKFLIVDDGQSLNDLPNSINSVFLLIKGTINFFEDYFNKVIVKVINESAYFDLIDNESNQTVIAESKGKSFLIQMIFNDNIKPALIEEEIGEAAPPKFVNDLDLLKIKRNFGIAFEQVNYKNNAIIFVNLSRATLNKAMKFKDFIQKVIESDIKRILIDLSFCKLIDSTFWGSLVASHKFANANSCNIELVVDENNTISIFSIICINKVFKVHNSLRDAINIE